MTTSRRQFTNTIGAAGVVTLAGAPPAFLTRTVLAAGGKPANNDGRILVVIQLAGGNDGLNTVIPFTDAEYYKNRPGIGVAKGSALKLNDTLGLHPQMGPMKALFDKGLLSIVQGIGYPNPDRSHFRSMDIWHSAVAEKEYTLDGWLGRALDQGISRNAGKTPALSLGIDRLPLALLSTRVNVPAIRDLASYKLQLGGSESDGKARRKLLDELANGSSPLAPLDFVRRTAQTAYTSADRLQAISASYKPAVSYPATHLAQQLLTVAKVIAGDFGTQIFYVSLDGFDTHSQQIGAHQALLAELSGALNAFMLDLKGHGLHDRVLAVTFSEFGRRVKENGSLGTDHGAGSQIFVASAKAKPGIYGKHPSLTDLTEGDLKHHTDFRSVYATLLENWLGYSSELALGKKYAKLNFI